MATQQDAPLFFSDAVAGSGDQRVLTFFTVAAGTGAPPAAVLRRVHIESHDTGDAAAPPGWRRVELRYKIDNQRPPAAVDPQDRTTWMPGATLGFQSAKDGSTLGTIVGTAFRREQDPPLLGEGDGALFCDYPGTDGRRVCSLRGTVRPPAHAPGGTAPQAPPPRQQDARSGGEDTQRTKRRRTRSAGAATGGGGSRTHR